MRIHSKAVAAVEEAKKLIYGLRFAEGQDAYVDGDLVTVTVTSLPSPAPDRRRFSVYCYLPGHLVVDWDEVAFFVDDEPEPYSLNREGRVVIDIPKSSRSRYTLVSCPTIGELEELVLSGEEARFASLGQPEGQTPSEERKTTDYVSGDGRVRATVVVFPRTSYFQVQFETQDIRIGNGKVHFQFVSLEGSVLFSDEIPFEPAGQGWLARYEEKVPLLEGAKLRFAIKPPFPEE